MVDNNGITDYIKMKLLNNRVEQYNTKRSYWSGMNQPRADEINTCLDLPDAFSSVINNMNTYAIVVSLTSPYYFFRLMI